MYERPNLGIEEAVRGLQAALEAAEQDLAEGRPVVVAIVDHKGDLVTYGRQDNCLEMSKILAVRKAWTAAIGRKTSKEYGEFIKSRTGESVESHVSPKASGSQGGAPILRSSDGLCLGGVGVSGASHAPRDEEIARIAIQAMAV